MAWKLAAAVRFSAPSACKMRSRYLPAVTGLRLMCQQSAEANLRKVPIVRRVRRDALSVKSIAGNLTMGASTRVTASTAKDGAVMSILRAEPSLPRVAGGRRPRLQRSKYSRMTARWLQNVCGATACTFAALLLAAAPACAEPTVESVYASRVLVKKSFAGAGPVTQMAWGPDGRLYASRSGDGAVSFKYDAMTGLLSDMRSAADISGLGIGFASARGEMYLSAFDAIWRLTDSDADGHWGAAPAETRVAIVSALPRGDHAVDQIQIRGDTLYVGVGMRTINGGIGIHTAGAIDDYGGSGMFAGGEGKTFGESAYGGTICWIQDLAQVPSTADAARIYGPLDQVTIQTDASPFVRRDLDKLVVHSAGARNPYGLALDGSGAMFFTNNYHRADTLGDGSSPPSSGYADAPGADLSRAVHDQFFRALPGADYGFRDINWRGLRDPAVKADILDVEHPGHIAVTSITPDNLRNTDANYLQLHDPASPVGLGPSSSADGVDFWDDPALPAELNGRAFIARWNPQVSESPPGTQSITYGDVVAVNPSSGAVTRVANGFSFPLAVLADSHGHLLVSTWGDGNIYTLSAVAAGDTDGDGIPDLWMQQHFGHSSGHASDRSRAQDDADGDGASNLAEYVAGTDPRNAQSVLRITSITRTQSETALCFTSVAAKRYRLARSEYLLRGPWTVIAQDISGTGSIIEVRDPAGANKTQAFYRVEPEP